MDKTECYMLPRLWPISCAMTKTAVKPQEG